MENKQKKHFKPSRLIVIIVILLLIIGIVLGLYWGLGLNKKLRDEESIKQWILTYGNFSRLIYIILHFVQSTLLPISNFPTIVAGNLIFNPWENALLTSIGVVLGSVAAFGIGKIFGRKAVEWVVGENNTTKLLKTFEGKEKAVLVMILLLPFFPDDIICFIAGITLIPWRFFIVAVALLRPIPIIFMCVLGSGSIIPFHGVGLIIWGVIILLFIIGSNYIMKNWIKVNLFFEKINRLFTKKH